jgi:hypothetical protein
MFKMKTATHYVFLMIPLLFYYISDCDAGDGEKERYKTLYGYHSSDSEEAIQKEISVSIGGDSSRELDNILPLETKIAQETEGRFNLTWSQSFKLGVGAVAAGGFGMVSTPFASLTIKALGGALPPDGAVLYYLCMTSIGVIPCAAVAVYTYTNADSIRDAAVSAKDALVSRATSVVTGVKSWCCGAEEHADQEDSIDTKYPPKILKKEDDDSFGEFLNRFMPSESWIYSPWTTVMSGAFLWGFYFDFLRTMETHQFPDSPKTGDKWGYSLGFLSLFQTYAFHLNKEPVDHPFLHLTDETREYVNMIDMVYILVNSGLTEKMRDLFQNWGEITQNSELKDTLQGILSEAGDAPYHEWWHHKSAVLSAWLSNGMGSVNFLTMLKIEMFLSTGFFMACGAPYDVALGLGIALTILPSLPFQAFGSLGALSSVQKLSHHILNPKLSVNYWVKSIAAYGFSYLYIGYPTYYYLRREVFNDINQHSGWQLFFSLPFAAEMFANGSLFFKDQFDKVSNALIEKYSCSKDRRIATELRWKLKAAKKTALREGQQGIKFFNNPRLSLKGAEEQPLMRQSPITQTDWLKNESDSPSTDLI